MNVFGKTLLILLFLAVVMLTSCGSGQSTPTMSDAEIMETAISTVSTTLAETQIGIPTATANAPTATLRPTATDLPTSTPIPTYTPLPELLPNAIDLQWMIAYGLPGDQSVTTIHPTKDGGFILVGNRVVGSPYDALLLKLRADGLIVWQKYLPQVAALDVLETSTGDFILAGNLHWTKLDSQGDILWQHTLEGPSYHTGPILRLVEESNGTILVEAAGSRTVFNADGELQSFTESDSQMSPEEVIDRFRLDEIQFNWVNPDHYNYLFFVQTTADGGAIVGNYVVTDYGLVAKWDSQVIISRFSEDGSMRWQGGLCCYLGAGYEGFLAFETKSGDTIVAGTVHYFADNEYRNHVWMFRLDRDGKRRWEKAYATEGHAPDEQDAITIIQELSNGDLLFAGQTSRAGIHGQNMWVLKTNAQGEIPNCGLMFDGSAGQMGDGPPEVEATPLEVEERFFGDAGAQAIPLCPPSP